jgi:hypothetical protein
MQRIDVRELHAALQSLARLPLLAAFRYQQNAAASPLLTLDIRRFADAGVIAAVADRAEATTLVTTEGRALTEIKLHVNNRAQPFMKVALPPGASLISVDVAGASAKPVTGSDGTRVPLLRPGFRPAGGYAVSFVYLNAATAFARKGEIAMTLPRMDLPVSLMEWEVFVPSQYSAKAIGGDVIDARLAEIATAPQASPIASHANVDKGRVTISPMPSGRSRQNVVTTYDSSGAVLPGVTVNVQADGRRINVVTDANGRATLPRLPGTTATLTAQLMGFETMTATLPLDGQSRLVEMRMDVGVLSETIRLMAESPPIEQPSQNVINLQQRASGVLPIRIDVPRAGTSHRFAKPLVIDQETTVRLQYKRK